MKEKEDEDEAAAKAWRLDGWILRTLMGTGICTLYLRASFTYVEYVKYIGPVLLLLSRALMRGDVVV